MLGAVSISLLVACGPGGTDPPDVGGNDVVMPRPDATSNDTPPVGMDTPPVGMDSPPVGMDSPPVGMDMPPVGMDTVRMDTRPPSDGGGDATTAPTWSSIYSLFQTRCAPCHITEARGMLAMPNAATAHMNLVGRPAAGGSCGSSGMMRVVAGNAMNSLLFRKINPTPPCGTRMPPSGTVLTTTEINRVRDWINAGARND